jgi:AcrR family transcriptional regulator
VTGQRRRLSREDWTAAALDALAQGGVAAVAIEPLASRLGATKGSAYWHFPNREALLLAALQRWEQERTDAFIEFVAARPDPRARLRALLSVIFEDPFINGIEFTLISAANDPVVAPILNRVTERRIAYVASELRLLGFGKADARRRSAIAHATVMGTGLMWRADPTLMPRSAAARRIYLDDLLTTLTAPPPAKVKLAKPAT